MRRMLTRAGRFLVLCSLVILSAPLAAGWLDDNLIDPEDGQFDLSAYLASARGFLPVPIIVTEPAVGFGLGAAVAYFHEPVEPDPETHPHKGPPSITVGFGAYTENGTYFYGGAHSGVWKDDHIRYLGAVAKVNVNMKFYPASELNRVAESGVRFNIEGGMIYQEMRFRLKESNWWIGADYIYLDADNRFRIFDDTDIDLPDPQFDFTQGGLGASVEYDGRNTTFTPSAGTRALLEFRNYDKTWGGDFDYDSYKAAVYHYLPFGDYSSLGIRLQGQTVSGDVPFFGYPFVQLRGIPAMRYQGEEVFVGELEYLWGLTPRWTLVLFGGVGKATAIEDFFTGDEDVGAGGAGVRYRLARKQGLQAGFDIARGPEDTSFYITVGSAWF